jgi:patatin-like phospholipase/acyl hydrolase
MLLAGRHLEETGVTMATTRIISIDGGGVRGIIPTVVLQRLAADARLTGWIDRTNLFAGTSTGGLIALSLAAGLDLSVVRALYEVRSADVFADSFFDDVRDLGKILGADYDVGNLRDVLTDIFGDMRLRDLERRVLVTAFDLNDEARKTWKPKIFHNYPGPDSDGDVLVAKVGVYTSAAPTYFASEDGYVDGGVFATNPSMCALAQTQDERIGAERAELHEVRLLSLGTGRSLERIEGDRHDWGYLQWVRPLISIMLDGVNGIADFQCAQILGRSYHRFAPTFPPDTSIDMDDVDRIPEMVAFAESLDLDGVSAWLADAWD